MMAQPGIGAMIGMLGGNAETVAAYNEIVGKKIVAASFDNDAFEDGAIFLDLEDGRRAILRDNGRSCCESRYITTDDDPADLAGKTLHSIELKDGPEQEDEYGDSHETVFVEIKAHDGTSVTLTTHNEHNGYYGGFWFVLSLGETPEAA